MHGRVLIDKNEACEIWKQCRVCSGDNGDIWNAVLSCTKWKQHKLDDVEMILTTDCVDFANNGQTKASRSEL